MASGNDAHPLFPGFQEWLPGWQARNWRNAKGEPVKNKELIQYLSALFDQRALEGQKVPPPPFPSFPPPLHAR